jgi:hypothetical protein
MQELTSGCRFTEGRTKGCWSTQAEKQPVRIAGWKWLEDVLGATGRHVKVASLQRDARQRRGWRWMEVGFGACGP